jgi:RNA polymerase subunit RPABC4/transcription elongation factor Spt4
MKMIICPVCKHDTFREGTGALSRRDNKTEICSQCGINEAMEDYYNDLLKDKIIQRKL